MEQYKNRNRHHQNHHSTNRSSARSLRRMEDKLDIILCDLGRIIRIMANGQAKRMECQRDSMDEAIQRIQANADRLKEAAEKELKEARERYSRAGEGANVWI